MIEVSGIRIPLKALDGSDERELAECRRALARKLHVSEGDLLRVERRRRAIDARKRGNEYSLVIENGSPRLAAIDTTVHELTHLWQYLNWDDREINRLYAMPEPPCTERARLILYEGMAMWSSAQLLYSMGETHYARQQESLALQRRDEYGVGFALYRDRFGFRTGGEELAFTPFSSFPPIEPEELRKATKLLCVRGDACEC